MFTTVEDFLSTWSHESAQTARVMAALTDDSLGQPVAEGYRTLGELAWHVVASQWEIAGKTNLEYDAPSNRDPVPERAAEIHSAYVDAAKALGEAVERQWTDETLEVTDELYGRKWPRGFTLSVVLYHEIHHRGQMTVLMRQARLKVPGVYGPSADKE
jgi:uncharacterized damage-inducible protein DinB